MATAAAINLLFNLESRGFTLRAAAGQLMIAPASNLSDGQRDLIRQHRDELLTRVQGCPKCKKPLLAELDRCWFCQWRKCSQCGKDTGSAFIELCNLCGLKE